MARHAKRVTASDLSSDMLAAVAVSARERGLANIETAEAPAEHLPFADGSFDFLACRYSAHHWREFEAGLRQARRVLKAGSTAVFMDVFAPGVALFDTHLQAVELLRDTSHCRDYSVAEWTFGLGRAGFSPGWRSDLANPHGLSGLDRADAHARRQRPVDPRAAKRPPRPETKAHFSIEDDGSFTLDVGLFEMRAE